MSAPEPKKVRINWEAVAAIASCVATFLALLATIIAAKSLQDAQLNFAISQEQANEQFSIENRAYIGLESFENLPGKPDEPISNIFNSSIKNFGNLPAYVEFDFGKNPFGCAYSNVNYIMPTQSLRILCERSIQDFETGSTEFCDIMSNQKISIRYGKSPLEKTYETVLKMRMADLPPSEELRKMIKTISTAGCPGASGPQGFQWYVHSAT